MIFLINFILTITVLRFTGAIVAYDCAEKVTDYTTFSLVDVGPCDLPDPIVNATDVSGKVIQVNDFTMVRVQYCKIIIKRTIKHCNFNSHTSSVDKDEISFIQEVSRDACREMHKYKATQISGNKITGLHINTTTRHFLTLAGSIDSNGNCQNAFTQTRTVTIQMFL